ncbi:MAG TPA: YceI family protein [Anaeromyxobacter sp.]|nr:YceI family protein [Anaeromyxobacter sp.]
MKRILATLLALTPVLGLAEASSWNLDPAHSQATFSVRHLVISNVRGEFGKLTGAANFDDKDASKSSVEATIDTTTIDTRVAKRDEDLKSENFFDVAKYPTITFKSTKVEKAGKGKLKVTGDLTMHGVTKPVVLAVEGPTQDIKDPWGNTRRGFSATTTINRRDFGLAYSKAIEAGPVVGDQVKIDISAEFVKEAGDKTATK